MCTVALSEWKDKLQTSEAGGLLYVFDKLTCNQTLLIINQNGNFMSWPSQLANYTLQLYSVSGKTAFCAYSKLNQSQTAVS